MICTCRCHTPLEIMQHSFARGVDVRNVLEAAIACTACQNTHAPALLNTALACDASFEPQGRVSVTTPEGRKLSWEQYQKEMAKRPPSWRQQDAGEGPEC